MPMPIARSPYMYAIRRENGEYLAKRGSARKPKWTTDYKSARWYAYFRYAADRREALETHYGESNLCLAKAGRNEKLCKAGGQKYRHW